MTHQQRFHDPWAVEELEFPKNGTAEEQLRFCLNYAVLAPSTHNTQPWAFRLENDTAELYADRTRMLPVTDPEGRELIISCGAALKNLIATLHHFGREGTVQYLPNMSNPDLLARVRLGRTRVPDYQDESIFRAIRRRRTTRLPFQQRRIPRALQRRLIWLASEHDTWLHFVESPDARERVASLVTEGDRRQLADPAFRAELADWIVPHGHDRHDGMSASNLGFNQRLDFSTPLLSTAIRTFDLGNSRAAQDRKLLEGSPVLVILGTNADDPANWLNAGQAMEQMLLRATAEEVTASYLNQPCEVPELREELRKLTRRTGPPQLLIRLGYGPRTRPSSRRPVSAVLIDSPGKDPHSAGQ